MKIFKSDEDKFRESLIERENENRPMIRTKEDPVRDARDYENKRKRILKEQMKVAEITGDKPEDIHIWCSGCEESFFGNIKEWDE